MSKSEILNLPNNRYYPKNGYSIELKDADWEDMDTSFLNFPKEEDWVLHGPYADKTLIRNVLAMQMANSIGQYAVRTRLVELLVNEQYEVEMDEVLLGIERVVVF